MKKKTKNRLQDVLRFIPGGRRRWIILVFAVIAVTALVLVAASTKKGGSAGTDKGQNTYTVSRGDLAITVTENGSIKAQNSIDIKSQVEGRVTIINIVPEGTFITPEDVNNGKVLAELDSSKLKEQLIQNEIDYAGAEASYAEAKEGYDIQLKQNESDIEAAKLKVKFAMMDFEKYLGQMLTEQIIADVNEGVEFSVDLPSFVSHSQLSGEALQKRAELENNIILAEARYIQASDDLEWTKKLYEKKYVAASELKKDELNKQSLEIKFEQAKTALELFKLYDFPKQAEKLLSDYKESRRELDRTYAWARSKLTQADAKLRSTESRFNSRKDRLNKTKKQIEFCIIKAPAAGQVVYGSSTLDRWRRQRELIEQGADVRERQKIISIPDPSEMKVEIKVHEIWIDKIKVGQKAEITIAAFPDDAFTGEILKKAPLADPENWLNPELKVYATDVSIKGTNKSIKTGMTAKVVVTINELSDVLSVPIQSVITVEDQKVCFVLTDRGPQRRDVETGLFNDNFVEIKNGLEVDEKVLLNPSRPIEPVGTAKSTP